MAVVCVEVVVVVAVEVIEVLLVVDQVVVLVCECIRMTFFPSVPTKTEESVFNKCPHKDSKARVYVYFCLH